MRGGGGSPETYMYVEGKGAQKLALKHLFPMFSFNNL